MKIRTISLVCIILVTFLIVPSAHAAFYSGNDLVKLMRMYEKTSPSAEAGMFLGFVGGVYDATRHMYGDKDNVILGQIRAVVTNYLKAHPERWNEPAADLVIDALKEAFPKDQ